MKTVKRVPKLALGKTLADADSTTRSVVKEVLIEAKKTCNTSAEVDVEEQIDSVALSIENNQQKKSWFWTESEIIIADPIEKESETQEESLLE